MSIIMGCRVSALRVFSSPFSLKKEEGGGELTDFCNNFF